MSPKPVLRSFSLCVVLGMGAVSAWAGSITVHVQDAAGVAVSDAVVYAEGDVPQVLNKPGHVTEIEQKSRKFVPLVTVIQTGSEVSFPNRDSVRHHVYSYSPAKVFDIKLYSGVPAVPQLFDKAGTVILGCNIHDQMVAYLQVVSTPYFGKTDANGNVKLDGVPAQNFTVKAWHYNLPAVGAIPEQKVTVTGGDTAISFKLNLKPNPGTR